MNTTTGHDPAKAAELLRAGELVAIPTETVYGLAANALDPDAVLKIFEAKKRPGFDPLIVHAASFEAIRNFTGTIPPAALRLGESFWPGPLTVLLPKKPVIPDLVTSGLDTVAVRIPSHPLTTQLLEMLDFPLAAPSANLFGHVSPTRAMHVKDQLDGKVAYILDGGDCGVGLESTIVGFPEDGLPTIYRLGGVPVEEIEEVIGRVAVRPHSSSNPLAPGMLKSHYAPRKPLLIPEKGQVLPENASYLRFSDYLPGIPESRQLVLSKDKDLHIAARNLFAALRELDSSSTPLIIAELLPDHGLGRAINDRLRRASVRE